MYRSRRLRSTLPYFRSSTVKAPVAYGQRGIPSKGVIFNRKQRATTVTQREYIGTLDSPAANANGFACTPYELYPTNKNVFQWLSRMAQLFENYKFHSVALVFETTQNTNTQGTIALGYDSDPKDTTPATYQQLSSYKGTIHASPWINQRLEIPIQDLHKRKIYYTSDQDDKRESITLTLYTATEGINYNNAESNGTKLGRLYIEYTISLYNTEIPHAWIVNAEPPPNANGYIGQKVTATNCVAGANIFTKTIVDTGPGFGHVDETNDYYVFDQNSDVLLHFESGGTALGAETLTYTGTGTATLINSTISADGTGAQSIYRVRANKNDHFTYTRAGTTFTVCKVRVAGYTYELA